MIVPMRKLSLLIYHQDYQSFLEELRERGVVHIYEDKQRAAEDETLQAKLRLVKRVNEMIRLLEDRTPEEGTERERADTEEEEYNAVVVNEQGGQTYFVTVTLAGTTTKPDADPYPFPAETEEHLRGDIERLRREQEALGAYLDRVAEDAVGRLKRYREQIGETTDVLQVESAAQAVVEDKVVALEGWVPVDREEEMKAFLETREVYTWAPPRWWSAS